ncbi:hypothetical protein ES708_33641 [subsurface metagenome]
MVFFILDIGVLPEAGYTVQVEDFYDNIGIYAIGHPCQYNFWDGVHLIVFRITKDKIAMLNEASSYTTFNVATAEDTWYTWRLEIDSTNHSIKVYRKTRITNFEFITEFTSLNNNAANDGLVEVYQNRSTAAPGESHHNYFYIAEGLHPCGEVCDPPVAYQIPQPPMITTLEYANPNATVNFSKPDDWNNDYSRVGLWAYGAKTAQGKIYRQFIGFQSDPTKTEVVFQDVYCLGTGIQGFNGLLPTWIALQLQICDIRSGVLSCGSQTVKADVANP